MKSVTPRSAVIAAALVATVVLSVLVLVPQRDCVKIADTAKSPRVREYLERWVDEHVRGKKLEEITMYQGGSPSIYVMNGVRVNWLLLKFSPLMAEVRIMTGPQKSLVAVYFGQDSRHGILVSLDTQFGVRDQDIIWREGRIAAYCPQIDQRK